MIIEIRNMMYKKNVYKIFLWTFLLMFIGGGIGINFFLREKSSSMITVYGYSASKERYFRVLRAAEKQKEYYRSHGIELGGDVKQETVQALVQSFLEKEVLDNLGVQADDVYLQKTLEEHLSNLPAYFFDAQGRLNEALFKQYLSLDLNDFFDEVKQTAEKEILEGILQVASYAAQFEINAQYNKEYADKTIEILTIPLGSYLTKAKANAISDAELATFYKQINKKDQFKTKEERAGEYWVFDKDAYNVTVTDQEVENKYNKDKATKYLETAAQVQVRQIFINATDATNDEVKARIQALKIELEANPDQFAETAKKISEDEKTRANGGLINFFSRDSKNLDPIIVKKSFESLSKDGQISEPLKIEGGYVLLQRVARKKATYKPLSSVTSQIKKDLLKTKYETRFMQAAKRMASQARYTPTLLSDFVTKHGGTHHTISLKSLESEKFHATQLFRTNKDAFNVYFDENNNGIVMRCTEIVPARSKELKTVQNEVEKIYYEQEAQKLLQQDVKAIMKEAATESLEKIAQKNHGEYDKAISSCKRGHRSKLDFLKNDSRLATNEERKKTIEKQLELLQYPGDIVELAEPFGVFVLKLDQLGDRDEELFAEKKSDMQQTLLSAEKYQKKESFIASLGRNAIINNEIEIAKEL